MTASEDTASTSDAATIIDATQDGGPVEEETVTTPPEPMPMSQKICLSVTAGFLACSVAIVFNVPSLLLSILSFFLVDHWIATTIIISVAAFLFGAFLHEHGHSKSGGFLVSSGVTYFTGWVAYAQYLGLLELLTSGTIGGKRMFFSGTGIGFILVGACGLTCCLVFHDKEPLSKKLPWLPITCVWSSAITFVMCIFASSIIMDSSRSQEERAALQERPASQEIREAIGEGRWKCTYRPKHVSVLCDNPSFSF